MSTVRDVVVASAGTGVAAVCGTRAAELVTDTAHSVDGLVALAAAATAAVVSAWYVLTALTLLLARTAARRGTRPAVALALGRAVGRWGAPVLRRAAVAGIGAGLVLGASPAWAADGTAPPPPVESLDGLPVDLRPGFAEPALTTAVPGAHSARPASVPSTATRAPRTSEARQASAVGARTYTVQPGDSLWSISAAQLGPTADSHQIAAEWPRWYRANEALLGSDPNLIHPGQELLAPEPKDSP